MCVSDMPALARFHTTATCRIKVLSCSRLRAFWSHLFPRQFFFKQLQIYSMKYTVLVPHLSSLTPLFLLMCVHPHKHMLLCVVLLWRTQSTSYPRLSLVTVSGLRGRTGSDRMDCCVIDFNLESAACCFPPSFRFQDPAGPHP